MSWLASSWRWIVGVVGVLVVVGLVAGHSSNDALERFEERVAFVNLVRDTADTAAHAMAEAALAEVDARREREQAEINGRRVQDAAAVATERARTDAALEQHDDEALARRNRELIERLHQLREAAP